MRHTFTFQLFILLFINSFSTAQSINDKKGRFYIQRSLHNIYQANYDSSLYYIDRAQKFYIIRNDQFHIAKTFNILGEIKRMTSNFDLAIKYHFKALQIREQIKDKKGISQSCYNISVIHYNINELEDAKTYALKSMMINEHDTISKARAHMILGAIHNKEKKYNQAKLQYYEALKLYEGNKDWTKIGMIYTNIGNYFIKKEQYDSTLFYYHKSLYYKKMSNEVNQKSIGLTLANMAEQFILLNQLDSAKTYLDKSQNMALITQDINTLIQNHGNYARLFKSINQYQKAYHHINQHYQLKDSIFNTSTINNIKDIEKKYQIQLRELEIKRNNTEIESLKQKNNAAQYQFYFLLAIGLTILVILLATVYIQIRKKANLLIIRKKEKSVYQLQLKNEQLEKRRLHEDIQFKNKELESLAVNILQKNNLLERIKSELVSDNKALVQEILTTGLKEDQVILEERINEINKTFHQKLLHQFPNLTKNELKLISLLKLSLSSKEIAGILIITDKSVDQARYRLRKKLNLEASQTISQFLHSL